MNSMLVIKVRNKKGRKMIRMTIMMKMRRRRGTRT